MKVFDLECRADKGKYFVLTDKGKENCASYKSYEVGKPVSDETWCPRWAIDEGYLVEVDDPDWVTLPGFEVVYNNNGTEICCGNPMVFYDKEMAERYKERYIQDFKRYGWDYKPYIKDALYEGKRPVENKTYKGKTVFVMENWFGTIGKIGDLVEHKIAMNIADCVPPRNFSTGYIQCGEPADHCEEGTLYATFVRIDDDVWEYKGNCLAGHTEQDWTPITRI